MARDERLLPRGEARVDLPGDALHLLAEPLDLLAVRGVVGERRKLLDPLAQAEDRLLELPVFAFMCHCSDHSNGLHQILGIDVRGDLRPAGRLIGNRFLENAEHRAVGRALGADSGTATSPEGARAAPAPARRAGRSFPRPRPKARGRSPRRRPPPSRGPGRRRARSRARRTADRRTSGGTRARPRRTRRRRARPPRRIAGWPG